VALSATRKWIRKVFPQVLSERLKVKCSSLPRSRHFLCGIHMPIVTAALHSLSLGRQEFPREILQPGPWDFVNVIRDKLYGQQICYTKELQCKTLWLMPPCYIEHIHVCEQVRLLFGSFLQSRAQTLPIPCSGQQKCGDEEDSLLFSHFLALPISPVANWPRTSVYCRADIQTLPVTPVVFIPQVTTGKKYLSWHWISQSSAGEYT